MKSPLSKKAIRSDIVKWQHLTYFFLWRLGIQAANIANSSLEWIYFGHGLFHPFQKFTFTNEKFFQTQACHYVNGKLIPQKYYKQNHLFLKSRVCVPTFFFLFSDVFEQPNNKQSVRFENSSRNSFSSGRTFDALRAFQPNATSAIATRYEF